MQEDFEFQGKPSLAKLLKYGADPNSLSFEEPGKRRTLLCLTIAEGIQLDDFQKVDLLLDAKADPNRGSETGEFPLQLAVKNDSVDLARKLIKRNADVNQHDDKLVSPLHLAVHQDHPRTVQLLLMNSANVNALDKIGQPAVFFASSCHVFLALLEREADILHLSNRGQSALHLAALNGAHDAVVALTDHEQMRHMIDLQDERGRTALHLAASKGHQSIVSRLMDCGADPRLKTHNGQTAMTLADAKHVNTAYYIYTRILAATGHHGERFHKTRSPLPLQPLWV